MKIKHPGFESSDLQICMVKLCAVLRHKVSVYLLLQHLKTDTA